MTVLNTTTNKMCSKVIEADAATGAPELCVVSAASIVINPGATLRAVGQRPLVLAASDNIRIVGTLDVSSTRARTAAEGGAAESLGAGAEAMCTPFAGAVADSAGGGSGGAGGSLAGRGGNGGDGNTDDTPTIGGKSNPVVNTSALTVLRGGCRGQTGGTSSGDTNGGDPGTGGPPGGVVYLATKRSIQVLDSGKITANGGGGAGGGAQAGGGGGGSGGLIVLEAEVDIIQSGLLTANGGGGGGGGYYRPSSGGEKLSGAPGSDGKAALLPAAGGLGQPDGNGALGAANAYTEAMNGTSSQYGAGGGGGGVGWIHYVAPTLDASRGGSSPPTQP